MKLANLRLFGDYPEFLGTARYCTEHSSFREGVDPHPGERVPWGNGVQEKKIRNLKFYHGHIPHYEPGDNEP